MNKNFLIGVNYWPSEIGTEMWSKFDEHRIEQDLKVLSQNGFNTIRIFPLWNNFQPIKECYTCGNEYHSMTKSDNTPLYGNDIGIDEDMCHKMDIVLQIAERYNLQVVFALLTGWMSSKMFVPSAFEGKNLITDDMCVMWEMKYVGYLVDRFKHSQAIIAWDFGNECNCLQFNVNYAQTSVWASHLYSVIRRKDLRPVISGLNCQHTINSNAPFGPRALRDASDILCTHPYPFFSKKCLNSKAISLRSLMHASCDTQLHQDLGEKPAFIEEIGTLGHMYTNQENEALFAKINAYEALSQGFLGIMWWAAFDYIKSEDHPYEWFMWENELGVMKDNKSVKPIIAEISKFNTFVINNSLNALPESLKSAVCILTKGQDMWEIAFGTYMLARQAGFNIKFCYYDDDIPDAKLYMLPSIVGGEPISKSQINKILQKVKEGSSLYISFDEASFLNEFENIVGARIQDAHYKAINFDNSEFSLKMNYLYDTVQTTAEIIIQDKNMNLMYKNKYGKGAIFAFLAPLERILVESADLISEDDAPEFYKIYQHFLTSNILTKKNKNTVFNCQFVNNECIITVICAGAACKEVLVIGENYQFSEQLSDLNCTINGRKIEVKFSSSDVLVFKMKAIK